MHPLSTIVLPQADALRLPLADNSVHCVVTSPPYWALRDYGGWSGELGSETLPDCEAWAGVDIYGRPGRDPRPDCCHVCNLRLALAEVWRVLHPSGTVWFNYGHMYAQEAPRGHYGDQGDLSTGGHGELGPQRDLAAMRQLGIKKGDLVLMRERLALAFQKDGWYVRSHVVWRKPNPMPGPAQTWRRPVDSHEIVYMLAKTWAYHYDAEAVREAPAGYARKGGSAPYTANTEGVTHGIGSRSLHQMAPNGRHLRDVWTITPTPYPGVHFAAYPPDLVRPCILAGTSEAGVCPTCAWPWKRVTEIAGWTKTGGGPRRLNHEYTLGWRPTCDHYPRVDDWAKLPKQAADEPDDAYRRRTEPIRQLRAELLELWAPLERAPAVVLDPFVGTGTTCQVARELGRLSVGADISFDYLRQEAMSRLGANQYLEFIQGRPGGNGHDLAELPLFKPEEINA